MVESTSLGLFISVRSHFGHSGTEPLVPHMQFSVMPLGGAVLTVLSQNPCLEFYANCLVGVGDCTVLFR